MSAGTSYSKLGVRAVCHLIHEGTTIYTETCVGVFVHSLYEKKSYLLQGRDGEVRTGQKWVHIFLKFFKFYFFNAFNYLCVWFSYVLQCVLNMF